MIINQTHGFIFVHVPKAAGTSVAMHLSGLSRWCDLELGGTDLGEATGPAFRERYGLMKHSTAFEIRSVVGEEAWAKAFTFGFVRNPYERAYSVYQFLRWIEQDRNVPRAAVLRSLDTFPKFVRSDYFRSEGIDRLLMPQMFWLRAEPASEEVGVKYVGRLERMDESMDTIMQSIGEPARRLAKEFPKRNESEAPGSAVWAELDAHPGMEEAIYWKYEVDFRIFGYERHAAGKKGA